jgi:hypothetical protein
MHHSTILHSTALRIHALPSTTVLHHTTTACTKPPLHSTRHQCMHHTPRHSTTPPLHSTRHHCMHHTPRHSTTSLYEPHHCMNHTTACTALFHYTTPHHCMYHTTACTTPQHYAPQNYLHMHCPAPLHSTTPRHTAQHYTIALYAPHTTVCITPHCTAPLHSTTPLYAPHDGMHGTACTTPQHSTCTRITLHGTAQHLHYTTVCTTSLHARHCSTV